MKSTQLSCGLLVINERGALLLGHSTGSAHWDLPKGLIDQGEGPLLCALRAATEEFGLDFTPARLMDLRRHAYYPGKDLHLFVVSTTTQETDIRNCQCTSYFDHHVTGQNMPEVDGFAWAEPGELETMLFKSMRKLLLQHGLLATARKLIEAARDTDRQAWSDPCGTAFSKKFQ